MLCEDSKENIVIYFFFKVLFSVFYLTTYLTVIDYNSMCSTENTNFVHEMIHNKYIIEKINMGEKKMRKREIEMLGRKFHRTKRYYEVAQLGKSKIQSCVCHLMLDLLEIVTNN